MEKLSNQCCHVDDNETSAKDIESSAETIESFDNDTASSIKDVECSANYTECSAKEIGCSGMDNESPSKGSTQLLDESKESVANEEFAVPSLVLLKRGDGKEKKKIATVTDLSGNSIKIGTNKIHDSAIPYIFPSWNGVCTSNAYYLEVLKDGTIIETISLFEKSFLSFGRSVECHVKLENPSVSRYHAILQFCDADNEDLKKGWHLYDLGSTHFTYLNKYKVKPKMYNSFKVGYLCTFGFSTRKYILQGPAEEQDPESEQTVTELLQAKGLKKLEEKDPNDEDNISCSWGFGEDAQEVEEEEEKTVTFGTNLDLDIERESYYRDDPKKILRNYMDREGFDFPDYQLFDVGIGKHGCRVRIPLDAGQFTNVEVTSSGKKKEAVAQCALQACRVLDQAGLLRRSSSKRQARVVKSEDHSDEDDFFDRTGSVEVKRNRRFQREKKVKNISSDAETVDSLSLKLKTVVESIESLESRLKGSEKAQKMADLHTNRMDSLDAYMNQMKEGAMDTRTRIKVKSELMTLRKEEARCRRLLDIVQPCQLNMNTTALLNGNRKLMRAKKPRLQFPPPSNSNCVDLDSMKVDEVEDDDTSTLNPEFPLSSTVDKEISAKTVLASGKKQDCSFNSSDSIDPSNSSNSIDPSNSSNSKDPSNSSNSIGPSNSSNSIGPSIPQEHSKPFSSSVPVGISDFSESAVVSTEKWDEDSTSLGREQTLVPKQRQRKPRKERERRRGDIMMAPCAFSIADSDKMSTWMPPADQTGDGSTHLNAKFGY